MKASGRVAKRGDRIRVLAVAESAIRRAGLESLIKADSSLMLAGSSPVLAPSATADVVLMDVDSEESPEHFADPGLQIPIVALIDEAEASWAAQAIRQNVRAILPRDAAAAQITAAINAVRSGLVLLDGNTAGELAQRVMLPRNEPDAPALEELTPREVEVLRLLAEGKENKEIAALLAISEHTVKFHISSILDKLDVATRTEAVTTAIRAGLILL